MKDPKNIEALNSMVMHYITLHGLQGIALEQDNPFAIYFMKILMGDMFPMGEMMFSLGVGKKVVSRDDVSKEHMNIPSNILHPIIQEAYDFYQEIDDMNYSVDPMMKEQIAQQLGDMKYDDFLEDSVETFKTCLFELVNNYNSNREEYIQVQIGVLKDKMNESVVIEDYIMAAEMRDKIKELKDKI